MHEPSTNLTTQATEAISKKEVFCKMITELDRFLDNEIETIAINCGFTHPDRTADLARFYDELIVFLGFPNSIREASESAIDWIHGSGGGCSPLLDGDVIYGRNEIVISKGARNYDWSKTSWDDVKSELDEDYLTGPYEAAVSTSAARSYAPFTSFEEAASDFRGKFRDLFRSSYMMELSDDENGRELNEFLRLYEQHPRYYIELAEKLHLR